MNVKTVYVEIVNLCNLNCKTCYNRSGLNKERRELSYAQLERILLTFIPLGLKRFLLSGGEPSLHSEFDEILELPRRYPHISFGIVTNGNHHHQKLIDTVNRCSNLSLQISLDGSCEEVNRLTRGESHFAKAVDFARCIHKSDPKPLLKMVVSQQNLHDVEAFCDLALSLGFVPEFAFIYKGGNGSDDWETKCVSPQQKMQVLRLAERINAEKHTAIFLPQCTFGCPFIDGLHDLSLCIKADGSIQPCQSIYSERYTVGNALDFQPQEFEKRMQAIADIAKQRLSTDYGCDTCLLRGACDKGCMAEAINLSDDPLASDGACEWRKLQFIHQHLHPHLPKKDVMS